MEPATFAVLQAMGIMTLPMAILLIFLNHKVRTWENKKKAEKDEELKERQAIAEKLKKDAEENALKIKQEALANAALRSQENMCIIRAIRDTGNLSRIITVATKAQANGEKVILNGDVDKALEQYDNTMKELDEFLMIQNATRNR
jgi:hypothetical protein